MSDIEQTKSGQKSRTGREWLNTLRSAKVFWIIGVVIILVGILLVLISPPPSCGGLFGGCDMIKGEVLEEGVLTIGTAGHEVNTTIPCESPYDCPCLELLNKYNAKVGGGVCG